MATLQGRLRDAQQRPVAGAELRLTVVRADGARDWADPVRLQAGQKGRRGGKRHSVPLLRGRTDARGRFLLLGLTPGVYGVEVRLQGAARWSASTRLVMPPDAAEEDLDLQLAAGAKGRANLRVERREVQPSSGEAESFDGGRNAGATALKAAAAPARTAAASESSGLLQLLPVPGRSWEAVEALGAGVRDATVAGGGAAQDASSAEETSTARQERQTGSPASGVSYDGLPATENAQTVDGLSADEAFGAGPRGAAAGAGRLRSTFAQGAVGRVQVVPRTYSAAVGGVGGGLVAVRSRPVGEAVHGDVFAQTRQSAWAAVNPFAVATRYDAGVVSSAWVRPGFEEAQFGAAAGVPLPGRWARRWGAGVFGAAEVQERSETLVSTPRTAGFFALTATQRALLANRGVSQAAVGSALGYLSGLTGQTAVRTPRVLGFGRVDLQPGGRDRVNVGGQVEQGQTPATGGGEFAEGVTDRAVGSVGASHVDASGVRAGWEHSFGGWAVHALRGQWVREQRYETPPMTPAGVPAVGPGGYAPQVAIAPEGFVYGTPASLGRIAYPDEERVEAADSVAVRLGRQVWRVGGNWSRVRERVLSATNLEGAFLYDSGTTDGHAGGLVDWITDYTFNVHAYPNGGCPGIHAAVHDFCFRSYAQSFVGAPVEFVTHQVAGWVEDSVPVGDSVRVQLGARYEYLLLPFPQQPNAQLDGVLRGMANPAAGLTASFPEDRNNVGPRVSVAWSPGGRGTVRRFTAEAGYGLFYGRLPGATIDAALANTALPGSTRSVRILPTTEVDCPQASGGGINQGFGYPCSFLTMPTGVVAQTTAAMVFSRRFQLPAVQRASGTVEGALGRQVRVRAEYATAWSTELPESVDVNVAASTGVASYVIQGGEGRPGLRAGQTFAVPRYTARVSPLYGPVTALESNANATYHSGTAEVRVENWRGWSVRASYTYARAIDYGPQLGPSPRQDGQFDPFTNGYDKGLSSFNAPQRLVGFVTYRSVWRGGPREVRAVLGGWRLAAIGSASSGPPYSYVVFGGTRLPGGYESINGSGGAAYLPTVGRNTLRLPMRGRADVRVTREVPLGGDRRLELRADAFNVLNSVAVSRVETRAFLVGTPGSVDGMTPLVFQDAATVASEGLTTPAFGTALSSTSGDSRERQIEVGARVVF